MLPGKTLAFANQDCSGSKKSKDRHMAMFCTNMDGADKVQILVIGKYKNPSCLKNYLMNVKYTANKVARITAEIFNKQLTSFYQKMKKKK